MTEESNQLNDLEALRAAIADINTTIGEMDAILMALVDDVADLGAELEEQADVVELLKKKLKRLRELS